MRRKEGVNPSGVVKVMETLNMCIIVKVVFLKIQKALKIKEQNIPIKKWAKTLIST